jgi:NADPH:quinone reductase-like Zn-dependent oxidoreductase
MWAEDRQAGANEMKAVRIHDFGKSDVLKVEDIPVPTLEPGEVLIKVHAASVNPIDWKIREGKFTSKDKLPVTLGRDASGTIEAVGAQVGAQPLGFQAGDDVFAMLGSHGGGYAEYAVAKVNEIALKPRSIDHVQAAAVPLAATTAWQGLVDHADVQAGQRVLIHGAAGGVGSFAVQIAKARGAYVYGTASSEHLALLGELGVDEAIDYKSTRFEDVVSDVDIVLDLIGGETQERSWKVLSKGGLLISTVSEPSRERAAAHGVRGMFYMSKPSGDELAEIAHLIDSGSVAPVIERVLPLDDARTAQDLSQRGHVAGKVVLSVAA